MRCDAMHGRRDGKGIREGPYKYSTYIIRTVGMRKENGRCALQIGDADWEKMEMPLLP